MGPLVIKPVLPPKPTTVFRNSVRELEPAAFTVMLPKAVQADTSDALLVTRTVSAPGAGATATTQEASPMAAASEIMAVRVCA